MQRPDTEHIVDLPAVLGQREHQHEHAARNTPDDQRTDRVHHVGAGADRDETGKRSVVHETRVVPAGDHGDQRAADHGHQRIHRHQAGDLVDRLRTHDVETEPADGQNPGAQRQERDR